jgi:hypothetical protein
VWKDNHRQFVKVIGKLFSVNADPVRVQVLVRTLELVEARVHTLGQVREVARGRFALSVDSLTFGG